MNLCISVLFIQERERAEMENEQNEKYTEDYMDHFGVKEEDKPGYTLGDKAVCPCRQENDTKVRLAVSCDLNMRPQNNVISNPIFSGETFSSRGEFGGVGQ
jgi:hypothetical protein